MYERRFESHLEGRCIAEARRRGWFVRKAAWRGRRGCPDVFLTKAGHGPLFVEFKDPKGRLSRLQEVEIRRLREAGCPAFVVRTFEQFVSILEGPVDGS